MTENTAQPLTRDDVRGIVSEEIGMDADLLRESFGVLKRGETTFKGNDSSEELGNHDRNYDRLARAFIESLEGATAQLVGHRKFGRDLGVAHGFDRTHNSSPSVVDAGAHTLGDGPGAGDASATPATEVTDPHISARYDAPLNAIAMSVGGTDDLYFDRDATFLLVDELLTALRDQAKNGGLA